jgi:hypothetical protein
MTKSTTFQAVEAATSGPYQGYYVWSDPNNWSNGLPTTGDTVNQGTYSNIVVDDLSNVSIATLADTSGYTTLWIAPSDTLTIGNVTDASGDRTSFDVYGTLIDNSPTNNNGFFAGNYYGLEKGGKIIIAAAAPSAEYEYFIGGTLAFTNPAATNTATISGLAGLKEVLELPGTKVDKLVIAGSGAGGLTVTTDAGTYAFPNFTGSPSLNYTTAFDASTGLVAITFLPATAPKQTDTPTSGPLVNQYVWSDPNNWSNSPPGDGVNVIDSTTGVDDISKLILNDLTIVNASTRLQVVGQLTIQLLTITANVYIDSDYYLGLSLTPLLVIDSLSGTGGYISANGYGAITEIFGSSDAGENYGVSYGGEIYLNYALSASSTFSFDVTRGYLALANPGATTTTTIAGVRPEDVLELPGTTISNLSLSGTGLTVTTDISTYTFTNFDVAQSIDFVTEYLDSSSGLLAIRFLGEARHDFGGDGVSDVLWQSQATGDLYEWQMSGGQRANSIYLGQLSGWSQVGVGDFFGTAATADVLWQSQATGDVYEWQMSGGQRSGSIYLGNLSGWSEVGVGDFYGAGTAADVLWRNQSTGDVYEWRMSGGQHTGNDVYLGNLSGWNEVGVGDFYGDGTSELLWQSQSTGAVYEWQMSSGQHTGSDVYLGNLSGWSEIGVGDFYGRGTDDLLWQNQTTGDVYEWQMSGGQHVGNDVYLGRLSGWSVVGTGDYSGNGVSDILWQNPSSGATYEWTMSNGQQTGSIYLGNLAGWSGK